MALAFLALAWLLGVAAAAFTGGEPAATLAAAGLLATVSFAVRPRPSTLALVAAGAALVFVAGWRYGATIPEASLLSRFHDGAPVRVRAMVSEEPDEQGASRLYRLDVREVQDGGRWRSESGGILMRASLFPEYHYGDVVEVRGRLEAPPVFDGFDYREYLFRRGVDSIVSYPEVHVLDEGHGSSVRRALIDVRSTFARSLSDILPEPEAALAGGILFGARSHIPKDLDEDMQATGTSHLVAVSGQNVVLLAALVMGALAWIVGRRPAAWLALASLAAYAILVGGQPSVVRAAIMGALYVVAIAIGRQNTAGVAIALAAGIMTAIDPQIVHGVSFQLSFAATLGLVLLTPLLIRLIESGLARLPAVADFPLTRMLFDVATMTLAATAFTLPVVAINFHRISVAAPLANLVAVPAFVAVATTAGLAALGGLVVPGDAPFLSWLAWPPAAYMIAVIRLFADLPAASVEVRGVTVEHAIAYYAALGGAIWCFARGAPQRGEPATTPSVMRLPRLIPVGGLAAVLVLATVLFGLAVTRPETGRLTVSFLDVGQGDAILIEGPLGQRVLVDGGPSGEALKAALGRQLPFYDRRLDIVALTHPQQDHIGGLPAALEDYSVRRVLSGPAEGDSAALRAWSEAVDRHEIPQTSAERGQMVDLGGGATITVVGPVLSSNAGAQAVNDASLVFRLTMGEVSFLLTGDIGEAGELALIRSGTDLRSSVLKVAHHGSRTSTSTEFVQRTAAIADVISVGADNGYGHPTADVLDRLGGDVILRTDKHGDVTFSTDGHQLWLQTQRGGPASAGGY